MTREEPQGGTVPSSIDAAPLQAMLDTRLGEHVRGYAEPLSAEEVQDVDDRLDAIEPAHTAAAAKLRDLFAG